MQRSLAEEGHKLVRIRIPLRRLPDLNLRRKRGPIDRDEPHLPPWV